jgi:hypothetical protein
VLAQPTITTGNDRKESAMNTTPNAWVTLDTVTLTNESQLYFDTSARGQPQRLYRLIPSP